MKNNNHFYKHYREYLPFIHNELALRENLEWSNFWWDKANESNTSTRYLLIGDSTMRMVRSTFAKILNKPVDMIGSSSILNDELFVNQIDAFFDNTLYRYDTIFIQLGHHGRHRSDGSSLNESDFYEFEKSLEALVNYLKQFTNKIVLETIFDAVIPHKISNVDKVFFKGRFHHLLCCVGIRKEKPDETINSVTSRKNDIIIFLSQKLGEVKLLDINKLTNKTNYVHIDHIHFEENAKEYIAKKMATML